MRATQLLPSTESTPLSMPAHIPVLARALDCRQVSVLISNQDLKGLSAPRGCLGRLQGPPAHGPHGSS